MRNGTGFLSYQGRTRTADGAGFLSYQSRARTADGAGMEARPPGRSVERLAAAQAAIAQK